MGVKDSIQKDTVVLKRRRYRAGSMYGTGIRDTSRHDQKARSLEECLRMLTTKSHATELGKCHVRS